MKTAKNCVFGIITSAFVGHENVFYTLLAPNMGIQRHPYDHSFAKKVIRVSFGSNNRILRAQT